MPEDVLFPSLVVSVSYILSYVPIRMSLVCVCVYPTFLSPLLLLDPELLGSAEYAITC